MPSRRTAIVAVLVFALAALGIAAYAIIELRNRPMAGAGWEAASDDAVPIGGAFELTDHTGRRVTRTDFAGKSLMVFFGFTHCPDVCPLALNQIALTMVALGDWAGQVQPLFITVDPERDTPQVMADYVAPFDAGIVGLTGSAEEIEAVEKSYRAYARKVEAESAADGYTMDHSAIIYLMGPDGRFITLFDASDTPDAMAIEIAAQIDADS